MGHKKKNEGGNVLFLILVAVALFAALSYIVMSSSRSGSGSVSRETAHLEASNYLQYGVEIRVGIQRMQISNNVPDWQFDLWSPLNPTWANGSCLTNRCKLFHPEGGAAVRRLMPVDTSAAGATPGMDTLRFYAAGVRDVGTSEPDLLMHHSYLTKKACQIINQKMGVFPTDEIDPPVDSLGTSVAYWNDLTAFPTTTKEFGGASNTMLAGKTDFCFQHTGGAYIYMKVILER